MKKNFSLIVLFSLFFHIHALENVDECDEFIKVVNADSSKHGYAIPDPPYEMPRILFTYDPLSYRYDTSELVYKRSKENLIYINYINDCWESFNMSNCVDWLPNKDTELYILDKSDQVLAINSYFVDSMSDQDIDKLVNKSDQEKKDLLLTIINAKGVTKDIVLDYAEKIPNFLIPISIEIKGIERIDSATSTYKSRYEQRIPIYLTDMEKSVEKIFNKSVDQEENYVLTCQYTEEEFKNVKIWKPQVLAKNIVSSEADSAFVDYRLVMERWSSQEAFDREFVPFINDSKFIYFYTLHQVTDSIATFKSSFDYRSFPLDRQTLRFDFQNRNQEGLMYFYEYTDAYKNGFNNLELYEWRKKDFEMNLVRDKAMTGGNAVVASYQINIERNYVYFITKIYLPIVIILLLAISVMWINPKELESRLTLSVVCFLALITYTFIIDKDLPKLSYLTIMDQIILISYVFAAIPTLESIYVTKFGASQEKAQALDLRYRKYLPLLYILLTLIIIFFSVSYNSENIIEALAFTT